MLEPCNALQLTGEEAPEVSAVASRSRIVCQFFKPEKQPCAGQAGCSSHGAGLVLPGNRTVARLPTAPLPSTARYWKPGISLTARLGHLWVYSLCAVNGPSFKTRMTGVYE